MTVLITGAGGHVGGSLVRAAISHGSSVLAVAGRQESPAPTGLDSSLVTWKACDLGDQTALAELLGDHRIDACIHAAAVSNEAYAKPDPLGAITANVTATANLLEAARKGDWRRFILVSTGSVFQKREDTESPIMEEAPTAAENIYSTTKVAAEELCRLYRSELGLSAAAVRLSWVYGPPVISDSPTRGPIAALLSRLLRGETIDEPGADFAASFTFIEDVAQGLLAAASAETLNHPIYHLGPGKNLSLSQVAAALRKAVPEASIKLRPGTEPWTTFTALRGPLAGVRLQEDTGFSPGFDLEKGIAAYAAWMRRQIS